MNSVYLSRRNLLTLLHKLDAAASGELTACTLIKNQGPSDCYRQTMKSIAVVAVEDDEYYASQGRSAGVVHPREEESLANGR